MKWGCALFAVAACGPLYPPASETVLPPWHPRDASDLLGHWEGVDRDDWVYELAIKGDTFSLALDRGDRGTCTETGTLVVGAHDDARAMTPVVFTYQTDTCNPSFAGASVTAYVRDGSDALIVLAWPDAIVELRNLDVREVINIAQ